jgi:ComF family protein
VPALGKILLYLVVVVLLGAVSAPPIYWILHETVDYPFYRYLSRVTQITAFVLLGPLLFWLGIRSTREFGLQRNPMAVRDAVTGFVLALAPGALLGGAYLMFDIYRIKQDLILFLLIRMALTAGFVAVVEEFLFRGVLLGLAAKAFGKWPAALGVSLAFAAVHFLRPGKRLDPAVEWWSGLAQIARVFDTAPPMPLLFLGFVSLSVAGMILAMATLWTRSLWLAIGLHAGWIFCQQALQWLAKYRVKPPEALIPWIGPNVVSGAVPTGLLPLGVLFFPRHCAACGVAVRSGWLCGNCLDSLIAVTPPRCEACSQPYSGALESFVCSNCRGRAFHFVCAVAVMQSRGVMRDLIHRFKYGGEVWLGGPLGDFLRQGLRDARLKDETFDGVVPVPLHPLRRREREFNQAEVLGRELARGQRLEFCDSLERIRYTVTQTHFDRRRRMRNLRDAFKVRRNAAVRGKSLLLVDDVLTTGSTLDECARVLLAAGARTVHALTVARG